MKYFDAKDTYTRFFFKFNKQKLSYCPDTSHECAARLIRKCVKHSEKNTHIGIWHNLALISHLPLRSRNIPSLKALTEKMPSRMPKMPKSHDPPLCAYVMKYDAHIHSHQRSWPKWPKFQISLKSTQKQLKLPHTPDRAPRFINKSVKWEKYNYWNAAKPGTYIMCPIRSRYISKFEGSSLKFDFINAKNA